MNTTHCPECGSSVVGVHTHGTPTSDCYRCGLYWHSTAPNTQRYTGKIARLGERLTVACAVCERDYRDDPTLVLARWRDQDICTDCLENRPGKAKAEAEARGARGLMTQGQYRAAGGGRCPRCQSGEMYASDIGVESGIMFQKMACLDCDLEWHDMYRLAGYARPPETPEGQADDAAFLATSIAEEQESR